MSELLDSFNMLSRISNIGGDLIFIKNYDGTGTIWSDNFRARVVVDSVSIRLIDTNMESNQKNLAISTLLRYLMDPQYREVQQLLLEIKINPNNWEYEKIRTISDGIFAKLTDSLLFIYVRGHLVAFTYSCKGLKLFKPTTPVNILLEALYALQNI